jgi:hypothetical protein
VGLQQHHRDALAGQQQGEHRPGRAGTDHTAAGLPHAAKLARPGWGLRRCGARAGGVRRIS